MKLTIEQRILAAVKASDSGLTLEQMFSKITGVPYQSLSSAVTNMRQRGELVRDGERKNDTGRMASVLRMRRDGDPPPPTPRNTKRVSQIAANLDDVNAQLAMSRQRMADMVFAVRAMRLEQTSYLRGKGDHRRMREAEREVDRLLESRLELNIYDPKEEVI
ncbi:MAG: hypothetical protein HC841_00475 [Verrucomicrobiae bacterium]|nr:hypothetical protein [Verrucomicrobiae bacterium]